MLKPRFRINGKIAKAHMAIETDCQVVAGFFSENADAEFAVTHGASALDALLYADQVQ